jgi:hypothetical protein
MKIAVLLAVVAVAASVIFARSSKKCNKARTDGSSNPTGGFFAFSKGYLSTPEVKRLRKSTAVELGVSIEELDRMLAKEIKQLSTKRELLNTD